MPKKKVLSLFFSFVLSAFLLWFLVSQVDADDFFQTFARIYVPGLLVFFIIAFAGAFLRAWRYKWLLEPRQINWKSILQVTFIRNLFVDLLPARLGSFSYIYVLNRSMKYSFESATSSFVVSFVLDFLTLSPFLAVSILAVGLGATSVSHPTLLFISLVFFLAVFGILWKLPQIAALLLKIFEKVLKFFKLKDRKWALDFRKKIGLTVGELFEIKRRKIDLPLFVLSLGIRLAKYISLYILLFSLLRSHGFSLEDLSIFKTILGITGAELTSALPIKGIGGFGTWESAWALTLMTMGFETRIAILSSGVHIITNLFEYILGIISILSLSFFKPKTSRVMKKEFKKKF